MLRTSRAVAVFILLGMLAGPIQAERRAYTFDRAHSQINFIAEAMFISAHGSFDRWEGDIQLDPQDLAKSTVRLAIEAASINTRIERRDNHLRSGDFFDATNHPQITFQSTAVRRVDDQNVVIVGDLTIRGVAKSLEVPARVIFLRDGDGRFKGQFSVNRKDFGVSYNSNMNPIEDMVQVMFDFHLVDQQMMEERQRQRQQQQPSKQPQT